MSLLKLIFTSVCIGLSTASFHASNCAGNRQALVHLFEWKWTDIANECEQFLGPHGYCGVQTSPPNENAVIGVDSGATEPPRPWWERYQPVSYKLETRSGTHEQFVDMVRRCNNVGVRIYTDAIINHMAGVGRRGQGTGGTDFDSDLGDFPGVPYEMANFNDCSDCPDCCCINAWTDTVAVRNCRLSGLIDLKQDYQDTHDKIADYLNMLISLGVAGFRVDASKHMWPDDLESIFNSLDTLNTEWFPSGSKAFVYLEVIDYNQQGEVNVHEYTHIARVTEFRFCSKIGNAASALWEIPGIYDPGWGMCAPEDAFVFVDNHDNQRGHGGADASITFKDPHRYKIAQAISLGYDYGWPRVMSSYDFGDDTDTGPPHDGNYNTADVTFDGEGQCTGGWVCEHRWTAIAGMAGFAKATNGMPFENWVNDGNKAAWSRGGKGFVAISNEGEWSGTFQTGMPAGDYCNIIKGCATSGGCVGDTITVGGDGSVSITVPSGDEPMIAIHVEAPAGSNQCVDDAAEAPGTTTTTPGSGTTTTPVTTATAGTTTTSPAGSTTTTEAGPSDWQTTIVYLHRMTNPGEDLFLRGGISTSLRADCSEDVVSDPCSLPIRHAEQSGSHFEKYSAWSMGDDYLDWYGPEPNQGDYQGQQSGGTPTFWTTNDDSNPGYQPDNEWGEHWWKVEFEMDCSKTEGGWFEVKGYGNSAGWEMDINQGECSGDAAEDAPYTSTNHMGRCGYRNIFTGNSPDCTIESI